MLAPTILIITSHLAGKASPDALDRAIKSLAVMKKNIILVLGPDGDDVLRTCSQLESCEIVFDPNDAGPFSPVKAGLHATDAPAYVWHLDRTFPEGDVWQKFEENLRNLDDATLEAFQSRDLTLLTRTGVRRLKTLAADSAWPIGDLKVQVV